MAPRVVSMNWWMVASTAVVIIIGGGCRFGYGGLPGGDDGGFKLDDGAMLAVGDGAAVDAPNVCGGAADGTSCSGADDCATCQGGACVSGSCAVCGEPNETQATAILIEGSTFSCTELPDTTDRDWFRLTAAGNLQVSYAQIACSPLLELTAYDQAGTLVATAPQDCTGLLSVAVPDGGAVQVRLVDGPATRYEIAVITEQAPACGGVQVAGLCWYMGLAGDSCQDTCASHGGYNSATANFVGSSSQGGSLGNCEQVLAALQESGMVRDGTRTDGLGLGCHRFFDGGSPTGRLWWLISPDFDPAVTLSQAAMACGCLR
jgi:hypothetical protein